MLVRNFEIADHTADICIKIASDTLEGLFLTGAQALYGIVNDAESSAFFPNRTVKRFHIKGEGKEDLLVKFLNRILFLFYGRRLMFKETGALRIDISGEKLEFQAEFFLLEKFAPITEVKAVTYGGINIILEENIYKTTVIADV